MYLLAKVMITILYFGLLKASVYEPNYSFLRKNKLGNSVSNLKRVIPLPKMNFLGYSEETAKYLAHLASISYCNPIHIAQWTCIPCREIEKLPFVSVVSDPNDNFQGFIGFDKKTNFIYIAFRGSIDIKNWLDNLTFYKTRAYPLLPNVEVHVGFLWAYNTVSKQIQIILSKLYNDYPNAKIIITGHSLGAAVAGLCAFDLSYNNYTMTTKDKKNKIKFQVHSLWTFGQPRLGNVEFTLAFKKFVPIHWRITHWLDIVPHVPMAFLGFQHTQNEVFYNESQSSYIICNDSIIEDLICSDRCGYLGCRSISDHINYLNISMSHLFC